MAVLTNTKVLGSLDLTYQELGELWERDKLFSYLISKGFTYEIGKSRDDDAGDAGDLVITEIGIRVLSQMSQVKRGRP